jgi:hypothetical protein
LDRDIAAAVNCHSGYSACDHPKSLAWDGDHLSIQKIIKEWREPGYKYYLVETANEMQFKLTFSESNSEWSVRKVRINFKRQG